MHLIRARLRNVPVLAEKAAHVAAGRAHRKHARPGQKMVQGFFLDRIDLQRGRVRVAQTVKLPAFVCANETETGLPLADVAVARTQVAMNFAVGLRLPPTRFVQVLRFVGDLHARYLCRAFVDYTPAECAAASQDLPYNP